MNETDQPRRQARIAFISGHIDISQEQFDIHYASRLDEAIAAGDSFIISSSRGADTLALSHLLAANVPREKITIYLNTPLLPKDPPKGRKAAKSSGPNQTNRRDPTPELIQHFTDLGVKVRMVSGDHERRDTVMTRESEYDILWVRSEAESKEVYGRKWRKGRVSGTEKNRLRRDVMGIGRAAVGRKGIGQGDVGEESGGGGDVDEGASDPSVSEAG